MVPGPKSGHRITLPLDRISQRKIEVPAGGRFVVLSTDEELRGRHKVSVYLFGGSKFKLMIYGEVSSELELELSIKHLGRRAHSEIDIRLLAHEGASIKVHSSEVAPLRNGRIDSSIKVIRLGGSADVEVVPFTSVTGRDGIMEHGVSVAKPDKDLVDYLRTRGITKHDSLRLVGNALLEYPSA